MKQLTKDLVTLRMFSPDDQVVVARLCNNKKIWDNVQDYFPSPYTEQNALEFIQTCLQEDPQVTFAIEYMGALAGAIGLIKKPDVYRLGAELGYWIGEPYWGKGIATEATKIITKYGFDQLGLVRIYACVFDFNKASQRVLEKAGFKLEAIHEKSIVKNGQICDEYRYAMTS